MSIVGNTFCNPLTTPVADIVPFRQSFTFWYPEQTQRRNWETVSIIGNAFCNPLTTPVADIAPFRQSLTFWYPEQTQLRNSVATTRHCTFCRWKFAVPDGRFESNMLRQIWTVFLHAIADKTAALRNKNAKTVFWKVYSRKCCKGWRVQLHKWTQRTFANKNPRFTTA